MIEYDDADTSEWRWWESVAAVLLLVALLIGDWLRGRFA